MASRGPDQKGLVLKGFDGFQRRLVIKALRGSKEGCS